VDLYRAMNVPIQDSVMGPGKGIVAANKALNFTCGIRNGSIYECSILLQRSAFTEIDFFNKTAKFEVRGEIAEELRQKFYLYAGEFHFKSSDNVLKIDSN